MRDYHGNAPRRDLLTGVLMLVAIAGAMGLSMLSEARYEVTPPLISVIDIGVPEDGGVVLATQADRPGTLHVLLESGESDEAAYKALPVAPESFTGAVAFDGLTPGKAYSYRVWFESERFGRAAQSVSQNGVLRLPHPYRASLDGGAVLLSRP